MSKDNGSDKIDSLLRDGKFQRARRLLEKELKKDPDNHWLLTQLGVTYYEQRRYREAYDLFRASQAIVPDCPLTLWNLAGALDALGKPTLAIHIYTQLLRSARSAAEDPCWESKQWTDRLLADCVYRLGVCYQNLGKKAKARHCLRHYLDVILSGIEGTYPAEDVVRRLVDLNGAGKLAGKNTLLSRAVADILQVAE